MTYVVEQEKWMSFLTDLSKRRHAWKTRIEVLKKEIGDQVLADGLPLNGITAEMRNGNLSIDLSIGESIAQHQTHTISDPIRIAFLPKMNSFHEVLDLEEADGTKTLMTLLEPMPVLAGYEDAAAKAAKPS